MFNAADRRAQFEQLEYTEEDYQKELEHIEEVELFFSFVPLAYVARSYYNFTWQLGKFYIQKACVVFVLISD